MFYLWRKMIQHSVKLQLLKNKGVEQMAEKEIEKGRTSIRIKILSHCDSAFLGLKISTNKDDPGSLSYEMIE